MGKPSFIQKVKVPDYTKSKDIITGIVTFDNDKCTHCGICVSICPARSIVMENKEKPLYLEEPFPGITLCITCGDCIAACPFDAIDAERSFQPQYYFNRLSQTAQMTYPKRY